MRKSILTATILTLCCLFKNVPAQSLPSNTCGVVYTYDAAGNRTQRKYICNNGPSASGYKANLNKLTTLKDIQQVDRLYPNPTTGRFTVTFTKPLAKAEVTLMDMAGRVLQQSAVSGSMLSFDISTQPAGMYLLRIVDGTNIITQKVVKQ